MAHSFQSIERVLAGEKLAEPEFPEALVEHGDQGFLPFELGWPVIERELLARVIANVEFGGPKVSPQAQMHVFSMVSRMLSIAALNYYRSDEAEENAERLYACYQDAIEFYVKTSLKACQDWSLEKWVLHLGNMLKVLHGAGAHVCSRLDSKWVVQRNQEIGKSHVVESATMQHIVCRDLLYSRLLAAIVAFLGAMPSPKAGEPCNSKLDFALVECMRCVDRFSVPTPIPKLAEGDIRDPGWLVTKAIHSLHELVLQSFGKWRLKSLTEQLRNGKKAHTLSDLNVNLNLNLEHGHGHGRFERKTALPQDRAGNVHTAAHALPPSPSAMALIHEFMGTPTPQPSNGQQEVKRVPQPSQDWRNRSADLQPNVTDDEALALALSASIADHPPTAFPAPTASTQTPNHERKHDGGGAGHGSGSLSLASSSAHASNTFGDSKSALQSLAPVPLARSTAQPFPSAPSWAESDASASASAFASMSLSPLPLPSSLQSAASASASASGSGSGSGSATKPVFFGAASASYGNSNTNSKITTESKVTIPRGKDQETKTHGSPLQRRSPTVGKYPSSRYPRTAWDAAQSYGLESPPSDADDEEEELLGYDGDDEDDYDYHHARGNMSVSSSEQKALVPYVPKRPAPLEMSDELFPRTSVATGGDRNRTGGHMDKFTEVDLQKVVNEIEKYQKDFEMLASMLRAKLSVGEA